MINPTCTQPIVILFERHWDAPPKQVAKGLIPKLADEGYDTFALEAGQDFTEEGIMTSSKEKLKDDLKLEADLNLYLSTPMARLVSQQLHVEHTPLADIPFEKLTELIRQCFSSKGYLRVAEIIKNLPAQKMFKEILHLAKQYNFKLLGTDIDCEEFDQITEKNLIDRAKLIEANEAKRITAISSNLLKFLNENRGIIYTVGALHAENLITKLKDMGLGNRVLYYFPQSNKSYTDTPNAEEFLNNETLNGHKYCLRTDSEVTSLVEKIVRDVQDNTPYLTALKEGTTSSTLLCDFFRERFQAFIRPGRFVDALLEMTGQTPVDQIIKKLHKVGITPSQRTVDGKSYLVVRSINTRPIAENLRQLLAG